MPSSESDMDLTGRGKAEVRRSSTQESGSLPLVGKCKLQNSGKSRCASSTTGADLPERDVAFVSNKDLRRLVSFVPSAVLPILNRDTELAPFHQTGFSVVMLADISGFTKLSEHLCSLGPEGVDRLSELISNFLGQLISIVLAYQGDIVGFAGDALIISWPTLDDQGNPCLDPTLSCTLRVLKCGLELAQLVHEELTLHIGIASGLTNLCILGDSTLDSNWCCLLVGEAILRMGDAERYAGSKQVVVAAETYKIGADFCKGEEIEEDHSGRQFCNNERPHGLVLLLEVDKPDTLPWKLNSELEAGFTKSSIAIDHNTFTHKLRAFIPSPAMEVLRANGQYLNEYRKRISVLFIMLESFPIDVYDPRPDGKVVLNVFQEVLVELQRVLSNYNGLMRQFIIDDKGCVFIACFGVSGHTHRDDPIRALLCGLMMASALEKKKVKSYTGLTTGAAFCGAVGSTSRREYALVGRDVNFAARLMSLSRKTAVQRGLDSMLILNEATYGEVKGEAHVSFEALPPVRLKGLETEVTVYHACPDKRLSIERRDSYQQRDARLLLVGREHERETIMNALFSAGTSQHNVCVIDATQGLGKSTFLTSIKEAAEAKGVISLFAKAMLTDKSAPYVVFRQLFWQLVDISSIPEPDDPVSACSIDATRSSQENLRRSKFGALLRACAERHVARLLERSIDPAGSSSSLRVADPKVDGPNSARGHERPKDADSADAHSRPGIITSKSNIFSRRSRLEKSSSKCDVDVKAPGQHRFLADKSRRHSIRTRRMSDPNARSSSSANFTININPKGPVDECKIGGAEHVQDKSSAIEQQEAYIESTLMPFFTSVLRVNWKMTKRDGTEYADRGSSMTISHANSAGYILRLALGILQLPFAEHHLCVFLDDAGSLDSLSGNALSAFLSSASGKASIVLAKSAVEVPAAWQDQLVSRYTTTHVEMHSLGREELLELIRIAAEGNNTLSDSAKEFILKQSQGNPGHAIELARSLREADLDESAEGTVMILEHAIQARFDRLPDTHRALLKTAAVIGSVFPLDCLQNMVPRCISRKGASTLSIVLADLVSSEWLDSQEDADGEVVYTFRSPQAKEVCYNLNPTRNLKMLHLTVAQFFVKKFDEDLRPYFGILAIHYQQAAQGLMALKYLVKAFRHNLNIGAHPESLAVLDSITQLKVEPTRLRDSMRDIQEALKLLQCSSGSQGFADAFVPQPASGGIATRAHHMSSSSGSESADHGPDRLQVIAERVEEMAAAAEEAAVTFELEQQELERARAEAEAEKAKQAAAAAAAETQEKGAKKKKRPPTRSSACVVQ